MRASRGMEWDGATGLDSELNIEAFSGQTARETQEAEETHGDDDVFLQPDRVPLRTLHFLERVGNY